VAEDQDLAGTKHIRGRPIKRTPIHCQPKCFPLRQTLNRGAVERRYLSFDEKPFVASSICRRPSTLKSTVTALIRFSSSQH
jgi:hypothetical protein